MVRKSVSVAVLIFSITLAPTVAAEPLVPTMETDKWYRIDDCLLCDAMRPGTYDTAGAIDTVSMTPCSWRRNTKPSDDLSYVIKLGKVDSGKGNARVVVNAGEYFFSQGCYPWHLVS